MSETNEDNDECRECMLYEQVYCEGVGCMLPICIYYDDGD
jgi:hypothetical protein